MNHSIMSFKSENLNFGEIEEGKKVKLIYRFVNVGTAPLIIYDVKPGCGCTSATWTKTPIRPKQSDSLSVVFDSRHRVGIQTKYFVIFNNSENKAKILSFGGIVNKNK